VARCEAASSSLCFVFQSTNTIQLALRAQPEGQADNTDIITEWGKQISPETVKTIFDYPRPQMVRSSFTNLNGLWEFKATKDGEKPTFGLTLNETILVPFPVESCLSGLKDANDTNGVPPTYQHMWYRTTVSSDSFHATAGGRTLLHFGAVDWQSDVYVNGLWVGSNSGGYNSFWFDITEALSGGGDEEIFVVVYDPSSERVPPHLASPSLA
jgi:beta-galactosidase/beta-glucuronidase